MKTITAITLVVALSAIAFDAGAAKAGPIVPPGHACLEYAMGGTDCGFTSYAQCEATASGQAAECYGSAVPDDNRLRRQFPRVGPVSHALLKERSAASFAVAQSFAIGVLSQPDGWSGQMTSKRPPGPG
jgi:Protein of unknown function (DUF3551)